jgi:hypothetical protein
VGAPVGSFQMFVHTPYITLRRATRRSLCRQGREGNPRVWFRDTCVLNHDSTRQRSRFDFEMGAEAPC